MVVPLAFMVVAETYAIAVNFAPSYRIPADALGNSSIGMTERERIKVDEEKATDGEVSHQEHGSGSEQGGALGTMTEMEKRDQDTAPAGPM
jgi:hypothetical protein